MTREGILQILRDNLADARAQAHAASRNFDTIIGDVPSSIPHPDGTYRIRNASIEYAEARTKLMSAMSRLNDFVIHGTVPVDLYEE